MTAPLYTCTAPYEVMLVTREVIREFMPRMSLKEVSQVVHALHAIAPDLDATDTTALMEALAKVEEVF